MVHNIIHNMTETWLKEIELTQNKFQEHTGWSNKMRHFCKHLFRRCEWRPEQRNVKITAWIFSWTIKKMSSKKYKNFVNSQTSIFKMINFTQMINFTGLPSISRSFSFHNIFTPLFLKKTNRLSFSSNFHTVRYLSNFWL